MPDAAAEPPPPPSSQHPSRTREVITLRLMHDIGGGLQVESTFSPFSCSEEAMESIRIALCDAALKAVRRAYTDPRRPRRVVTDADLR